MIEILTWIVVLIAGGLLAIVGGAVFIWALFWMQNGGNDD